MQIRTIRPIRPALSGMMVIPKGTLGIIKEKNQGKLYLKLTLSKKETVGVWVFPHEIEELKDHESC